MPNIRELALELGDHAMTCANNQGKKEAVDALKKMRSILAELEKITPGASTPMQIKDFFDSIGTGMVAAQQTLDDQSLDYLKSRPGFTLPSVFRIPKASAEIQFAIETEQEQKFNVIVYGASDSRQQSQQHKVSFDIVSVPPPAEVLAKLEVSALTIQRFLETNPLLRMQIRERVSKAADGLGINLKAKVDTFIDENTYPFVLVFRIGDQVALILPQKHEADVLLDAAYLLAENRLRVFPTGAPKGFPPRFKPFFNMLLELSVEQGKQLAQSGEEID